MKYTKKHIDELMSKSGHPKSKDKKKKKGKIAKVMHEWKSGKLHSGSKKGPVVRNQKQAIAIAISEAKKKKKKG